MASYLIPRWLCSTFQTRSNNHHRRKHNHKSCLYRSVRISSALIGAISVSILPIMSLQPDLTPLGNGAALSGKWCSWYLSLHHLTWDLLSAPIFSVIGFSVIGLFRFSLSRVSQFDEASWLANSFRLRIGFSDFLPLWSIQVDWILDLSLSPWLRTDACLFSRCLFSIRRVSLERR